MMDVKADYKAVCDLLFENAFNSVIEHDDRNSMMNDLHMAFMGILMAYRKVLVTAVKTKAEDFTNNYQFTTELPDE